MAQHTYKQEKHIKHTNLYRVMTQYFTSKFTTTRWGFALLIAFFACAPICAHASYIADDYYYDEEYYYDDEYYYEENVYYGYESDIYDAFASSTPNMSGRKNAIGTPSDPDAEHTEYPIGEPWIMVILAIGAAGYTYIQQRKKTATDKQNIN